MPKLKIAVCIPVYGNPEALFMQSLVAAQAHFYEAKLTTSTGEEYDKSLETLIVQSSMLTESRHRLVAEAMNCGADYMLWCDADHVFPKDAICKLWARNVQVVGANYARRCKPTAPTAAKVVTDDKKQDHKNLVYTTIAKAKDGDLEEVHHLGFGLTLIRMDVYNQLQVQAEKEGKATCLPMFMFQPTDDFKGMIGEDVFFYKKVREAGVKVWCDHGLSWDVGHISNIIMTNAHAVTQEQAWIDQTKQMEDRYKDRIRELEAEGVVVPVVGKRKNGKVKEAAGDV